MDWVTAVEIPRLQAGGAGRLLARLVAAALGLQVGILAVLAVTLALISEPLASWLGQPAFAGLFRTYAAVLLVEGASRAVRDQMLSSLLMQGAAQLAQALRNAVVLGYLVVCTVQGPGPDVHALAWAELWASAASLALGGALLARRLAVELAQARPDAGVTPPTVRGLRSMALNAWTASLTAMLWGGQVVVLLASRILGAEAAAMVGFARNLAEQIRKLMPVEFLFHLIRTLLAARYATERDPQRLLARIALAFKSNLIFLLPVVLLFVTHGDRICGWVSSGRYAGAHGIVVGWMLWVLVWSHHRLAESLAHLTGRSSMIGAVSVVMLGAPALYAATGALGGPVGLVAGLVIAELVYVGALLRRGLAANGVPYPVGVLALPRLALACGVIVAVGLAIAPRWPASAALAMLIIFVVAVVVLRLWSMADAKAVLARGPAAAAVP
jgi:hypothetical protein